MNHRIVQFYYTLGELKGLYEGLTQEERSEVFGTVAYELTFYRAMKDTVNAMRERAKEAPVVVYQSVDEAAS